MNRTPRQRIVDRLTDVEYIDCDTVGARCPVCGDAMAVTFNDVAVAFRCCFNSCSEERIARAVFNRPPETEEEVVAHRKRLTELLMLGTAEPRQLTDEAA